MARYPNTLYYRRLRLRRWIYIGSSLLALVLIVAIVLIVRAPSEPQHEVLTTNSRVQTPQPPAEKPVVEEKPTVETRPQPPTQPEPQLQEPPPSTPVRAYAKAAELIEEANALLNANPARIIKARDTLNDALKLPMSPQQTALVKEQLSKLADKWLFSRDLFALDPLCASFKVQPGDRLLQIAERHKVPWELLQRINYLPKPEALQAGQVIKVVDGPFHAKVNRASFTMDVYLQQTFVRSFPVGLGSSGKDTPTGLWIVKQGGKLISPPWTDPDTGNVYHLGDLDYPLGSRWIALEGIGGNALGRTGFGIHGTKDPKTIGAAASRGCIRLHNGDAIKVYDMLTPELSRVIVE